MADFGDYAGQYLTMAREAPRTAAALMQTDAELQKAALERPGLEATAALAPEIARAKLQGTPFEQRGQAITMQDMARKNAMLQQSINVQQENQRRQASIEQMRLRQEADQNALQTWQAAMKAYEAGIGPHPGAPPNLLANNPPTSANKPFAAPAGQPAQEQPWQTKIKMPDDLKVLPPGLRNQALAERIKQYPDATAKLSESFYNLDRLSQEATALAQHEDLPLGTGLTGMAMRNIPSTGAKNFGNRLESLKAQIAFATLGQMRSMSTTGGALGQVSNQEEQMLSNAIAALDPQQSADDFRRSLQQIKQYATAAKKRLTDAYTRTYGMAPDIKAEKTVVKPGAQVSPETELGATEPQKPQPTLSAEDQQAIAWAKANPNDPRAAKILGMHGGL